MPFDEALALGSERWSELLSRARKTTRRLKHIVDTLSGLSSAIQREFEAATTSFNTVSKIHGLITLPNELLARIFNYVVNWDEKLIIPTRTRAAVGLSHVCRYFRDTAISCTQLWTNVSSCGDDDITTLCLSRSKRVPLNVRLVTRVDEISPHPDDFGLVCDPLAQELFSHSKRWGQLEIRTEVNRSFHDVVTKSLDIGKIFRELDVPLLRSLHILRNSADRDEPNLLNSLLEGWRTPNLRYLTTNRYLPLRLAGAENLESFDVTLEVDSVNLTDTVKALSRMTSLEEFHLTFIPPQIFVPIVVTDERACLPNVRHLRIGLSGLEVIHTQSRNLLQALFAALSFPGSTDLHLDLSGVIRDDHECVSIDKQVMWLFQHPNTLSRVERFCLEASDFFDFNRGHFSVDIPFGKLPSLKELELYCNTRLIPCDYSPGDTISLALERLIIRTTEIGMLAIAPFTTSVLRGLKEVGKWESFRELVIINTGQQACDFLGTRYATKSFVGDAALQWCIYGVPDIPTFN
ncbi:hypothetical protein SCHPADRAFT_938830 [Schizopora paradoxa]|uniref:F-box domain-containing protein n=1 Tax=Schizopora paradoxa TaxID=27342 RepID=A0A0H2S0N2_9AGAM|nr:hypothetical protein SCHPADRAFT_938830 [Schizopora paradoxa]